MKKASYIVSACLIGERCRYNGEDKSDPEVICFLRGKNYVALCPEMLAGWGSPRLAVQFCGGGATDVAEGKARIKDEQGMDRTESLMQGISMALEQVQAVQVRHAILKEKSPSCGVCRIYCDGKLTRGEGLFTHWLRKKGVQVKSEESLRQKKRKKI